MRVALFFSAGVGSAQSLSCRICHSLTGVVTDNWCGQNCNAELPNCPSSLCACEDPIEPPAPEMVGYYSPSWDKGSVGPHGSTFGIAFTGWVDPAQAIDYEGPALQGAKWVSVGGGNDNGKFTSSRLSSVVAGINDGTFKKAGYEGICFDVEECDAGLAGAFSGAFAAAKAQGLKVFVTTSHSAPYGCPDGAELVAAWLKDENLDFVSPQMYTSGAERCADFDPNDQLAWDAWKGTSAKIVPSICEDAQWPQVYSWFVKQGLPEPVGFVQWKEVHAHVVV